MMISNNKGYAFVGAIALVAILSIAAVGFINVIMNGIRNETQSFENDKAFFAAEAGFMLGTSWVNDSVNWEDLELLAEEAVEADIIPDLTINGYDIEIDIIKLETDVTIRSTAKSKNELGYDKVITQNAEEGPAYPPNTQAFEYAMMSEGVIKIEEYIRDGAASSIHSNDALKIEEDVEADISSSVKIEVLDTVTGNVTAPEIENESVITGTENEQAVAEIPFPDIDLTPFKNIADANSQKYTTVAGLVSGVPETIPGGVVWLDATGIDIVELGGLTINGTLIISGTEGMTLLTGGTLTGPSEGFAIACETGDIKIEEAAEINGLIYAKDGCCKMESNGTFSGQILAKGRATPHVQMDMPTIPGPVKLEIEQSISFDYQKIIPLIPGTSGKGILVGGTWIENNNIPVE